MDSRLVFLRPLGLRLANANYVVSGSINLTFVGNGKDHVYIETLGGPAGTTSVVSPDVSATGWNQYSVTNAATPAGTLEVRIHSNKETTPPKLPGLALYLLFDAFFDNFSLTPQ